MIVCDLIQWGEWMISLDDGCWYLKRYSYGNEWYYSIRTQREWYVFQLLFIEISLTVRLFMDLSDIKDAARMNYCKNEGFF